MNLIQRWLARRQARRHQEMAEGRQQAIEALRRNAGNEPASAPATRIDEARMRLVADAQHLNATMFLAKMLVATHHDNRWLKRTWEMNITQLNDTLIDAPAPFGDETLKQVMLDAWKLSIQDFTRLIDQAVVEHRSQSDDS
jgi:hypothetical protein